MKGQILKVGIPTGSLQNATTELFGKAGFHIVLTERNYSPGIDDEQIQLIMLRAQEMSKYVEDGVLDAGITGYDWIMENSSDVVDVCELAYSKTTSKPARWVLAVPDKARKTDSRGNILTVRKPEDLEGGTIATELVNVTKKYFADKGINARVEFSWGATEAKVRLGDSAGKPITTWLVDGIVELTETGESLQANNLREIDTVITSTTRFIANKQAMADSFKHQKIEDIVTLLNAAIDARSKVGLKMNVNKSNLKSLLKILPAEKSPTISSLADADFVAIEAILDEKVERQLVPQLKRAGASGIITYPLNKVIH